jgi:GR25 family glycosyltransferase involved in LPS biosynthesis
MILDDSYISFINLDHRTDRLQGMNEEMKKLGIPMIRQRGIPWAEVKEDPKKIKVMKDRTPGAIGCHYSQVEVMKKALELKQHAFVMEDDLMFCDDFHERMEIVEDFLSDRPWDVFWLGGTYHHEPTWHKRGHPQLPECKCSIHRDVEETSDKHIVRTYGCWSTYAYIINRKSLPMILDMLDANVHKSMGIDWLFILLAPRLFTYAFVPGMVRQRDSQSDIGNGMTYFSHFEKLGPHWYQQSKKDFDYQQFYNRIK